MEIQNGHREINSYICNNILRVVIFRTWYFGNLKLFLINKGFCRHFPRLPIFLYHISSLQIKIHSRQNSVTWKL